jgi:serine phosphatase RsbU (regulator of sigma subunit)
MVIECNEDGWFVEDLRSKNGTALNGEKLEGRRPLKPGDKVSAGHVTMTFEDPLKIADETLLIVDEELETIGTSSVSKKLEDIVSASSDGDLDAALSSVALAGTPHVQALMDAGRELATQRPLAEMFRVILDLSIQSVGARRGALLTRVGENDLIPRAVYGEGLRIPRDVVQRVVEERTSLLVKDAKADEMLRSSQTIVEQSVRSLIAVPLQTRERVTGMIYLDSPHIVRPFSVEDLNLLTVMANMAAIRVENARLQEVEEVERLMSKELDQAADIQRNLLPKCDPHLPGLDVAGHSLPCRSVGGDYFDYLYLPDGKFGVIVADVAGKGLPAAMLMSSMQARVQILAEESGDLSGFVSRLNRGISANCPGNRFITFFMVIIDARTGEFTYCNAGHNPPFLVRANGAVERLEEGGPVLGILRQMTYKSAAGVMVEGDMLAMYSDGVSEARNPADEEYDEEQLLNELMVRHTKSARAIVDETHTALMRFMDTAPAGDDITFVVMRKV